MKGLILAVLLIAGIGFAVEMAKPPKQRAQELVTKTKPYMEEIHKSVVDDQIAQFVLAVKGGDKMQICMQAGILEQALLQAKMEKEYLEMIPVKKKACKQAGVNW